MTCGDIQPLRAWDDTCHPMRFRFSSNRASSLPNGSLTRRVDKFRIRSEKLLQGLRIPASNHTNSIGRLVVILVLAEVLPKLGQMIERVRVDSLLRGLSPLLVGYRYITNRPPDRLAQSFDEFLYRWSFADEGVYGLGWKAGVSEESCSYAGHIYRTGEWNDGF